MLSKLNTKRAKALNYFYKALSTNNVNLLHVRR